MKYTAALLVTIAAFAASATAAPALCSEAARFGFFNLEQTKATEGQQITLTYKQNCPNEADIHPYAFNFALGNRRNFFRSIKLNPTSPPPVNPNDATFTFTIPDYYITGYFNPDAVIAELVYNQPGPHGGEATHLYSFSLPLNITQG